MFRSSCYIALIAALAAAYLVTVNAFVLPSSSSSANLRSSCARSNIQNASNNIITDDNSVSSTTLFMSADTEAAAAAATTSTNNILSLQLEKPLGLILEEASDSDSSSNGVIVTQVNEGGSAYNSPSASLLPNSKIVKVMDVDVSSMGFDDVMGVIVDAPSPLVVEFALPATAAAAASDDVVEDVTTETQEEEASTKYEIGTTVSITVEQPEGNKAPITLEAKVGDNLRKTLLSNKDIELYRGLKKKLGNCGGGGQCGYCAVELIDNGDGVWGERSEYEDMKIGNKAGTEGHRLACMNNIVGPATIKTL